MFEKEKLEIIKGGLKLDRYGLIALAGGNLSMRMILQLFSVCFISMTFYTQI